ncbi:MAG: hypothetical protein LH603_06475 [Pseudonocardia sp.]|nr:hypothetical protein [Pseudonocardia sp.]
MIREVLSSALGRATREELVTRNVAQLTTLPVLHRARRQAWTAAQARAFLPAARKDPLYPAFLLGVVYGLRRGEIAALRWHSNSNVTLGICSEVFDSSLNTALLRMENVLRPQPPQRGR